jgi:hypothetical protein
MLKKFEEQLLEQSWEEVQPGVDVKLCRSPEGTDDTFVLCRSQGRKEKENAILGRFVIPIPFRITGGESHGNDDFAYPSWGNSLEPGKDFPRRV